MSGHQPEAEQRLIRHYRNAVGRCGDHLSADLAKFQPPAAAGPFRRDQVVTDALATHKQRHPRRRLLNLNLQQSAHKIANIADHLKAMQAIFTVEPPLAYAPSTTTRVIVEAAAGLHALLDVDIDTEERLLRASSTLLESFHHEVNATRQLPGDRFPNAVADAERRLSDLIKLVERAGMEVSRQANGKPKGIRWIGSAEGRSVPHASMSQLIELAFGDYPALYQMGSGVAHSMSWMLADNARVTTDDAPAIVYTSDPYSNGAAAVTAIAAVEVVVADFGGYMGFDPEQALVPYTRRRKALDGYMNEYARGRVLTTGSL